MEITGENLEKVRDALQVNLLDPNSDSKINIYVGKDHKYSGPDFVFIFQIMTTQVMKSTSPSAFKLLHYFINKLTYSNHIGIDQKTMAEDCDMSLRSISGAISELISLCIIVPYNDPQDNRRKVYMMNPFVAWKGKLKEKKKKTKEIENNTQLSLQLAAPKLNEILEE